jgi:predicted nucleic acid-binding protein
MPGSFLDSNVLLYMATEDDAKAERSSQLLRSECVVSVQVLNEIANVLRLKRKLPWERVREFLGVVEELASVMPLDVDCHKIGMNVAEHYGFSIYDSMIVAAALQADCDILYSEDMQHGQTIDALLTVVNPYL